MDSVNHPKHYTSHPSGVECIEITEHMNFNMVTLRNTFGERPLKARRSKTLKKQSGTSTEKFKGLEMRLNELAALTLANETIQKAQDSSQLESRAIALYEMSVELHKSSIDLRLQAEELLNFLNVK